MDVPAGEAWFSAFQARLADGGDGEGEIALPAAGGIPGISARLASPDAVIRALPNTDTPTSSMVTGLERPAQALLWRGSDPGPLREPQSVELDGQRLFNPSLDLTGIHLTPPEVGEARATPVGFLVGRAERRAWIRTGHGNGDFTAFIAELGWEPAHIDLADLELMHLEYLRTELVSASRIQLEDLDTSPVEEAGWAAIALPTLGRKVTHELLLQTLDGELLDKSGPYGIVETIRMTPVINGHAQPPMVSGITDPPPELDHRLKRADEITATIEGITRDGIQARVIADRQTALERLAAHLERARGELLVRDQFFGQHIEEWRLLDKVPVPVRVLTGKIDKDEIPEIAPHVQARHRRKGKRLHERVYLWEGGGLSVGGSPSTFGNGLVRMTRIRPSEAEVWRAEFEALWDSGLFRDVPRRDP